MSAGFHGGSLRAVVMDVDGTLVDSERDGHRVAFNHAFATLGLPYSWSAEAYGHLLDTAGGRRRIAGFLRDQGLADAEAESIAVEAHRLKSRFFELLVLEGAVPLREGVRDLVQDLRDAGVRLHVATTGSRSWVEPLLAHHFDRSTFELVVTGSDVTTLKPAPDVYSAVLRGAGLTPDGVVAVEDSHHGLLAAHGAGLRCVVVPNEYTHADVSAADLVVSSFGPDAEWISGVAVPLPGRRISRATLDAVASAGAQLTG